MQGYCLKCRAKQEMNEPKEVTLKNGRAAMQGTCPVCGTKITVIGGKKAAEGTPAAAPKAATATKPAAKAAAKAPAKPKAAKK